MTDLEICCADGEYGKDTGGTLSCATINDTNISGVDENCQFYKNGECVGCSTGTLNPDGCCGANYKNSSGACVAETPIANCGVQVKD